MPAQRRLNISESAAGLGAEGAYERLAPPPRGPASEQSGLPERVHARGVVPTGTENPGSPPAVIGLEPLPCRARHRSGKEFGMHDLGEDLEALNDARARAVEVGGAIHSVDVS